MDTCALSGEGEKMVEMYYDRVASLALLLAVDAGRRRELRICDGEDGRCPCASAAPWLARCILSRGRSMSEKMGQRGG
jgi:hypothetical protein